ncbi:MAG: zinc-ribbon domain-containing protein [Bacilli bacterium]|nr:zinc-ribbon domain-containing protein [Bacilli bacterium]
MKCPKCEKEVKTTDVFCSSCGTNLKKKKSSKKKESKINQDEIFNKIGDGLEKVLDTEDTTKDYTKKDVEDNKGLALLSYLGPLALVPYFYNKGSKYVKYHAVQGMNMLVIWVVYSIVTGLLYMIKFTKSCEHYMGGIITNCVKVTPWWVRIPVDFVGMVLFAIAVIGVFYALTGKAKKLPLVDKVNVFKEKE